ncbi:MAG: hypothetical protein GX575_23680, partial [Candidatus Anammoximicrobium sp.]|nr:hypothetical protein [Candidatus Anammoximicrobium sp.]
WSTGGLHVLAGTVKLGTSNVIPNGSGKGDVTVTSPGILDLNGSSETINGLSGTGTVDTGAGGTPTLTVGGNNTTSSFSGVIQDTAGTLALTKIGSGTLTLSGANTYSGVTTISAGTLRLGSVSALGVADVVGTTVASGAVLDLNGKAVGLEPITLNGTGISSGGALINSSGTAASLLGTITLASASSLGGSGPAAYRGYVDGGFGLTLVGAGTKTFENFVGSQTPLASLTQTDGTGAVQFNRDVTVGSGGATFQADVTLDGMTFSSGGGVTFGNTAADTLTISGGATTVTTTSGNITLNGTTTGNQNLTLTAAAGVTGSSAISIGSATATTLTINQAGNSTYSGVLGGATAADKNFALVKQGAGTLTLSGANTYTGGTTITGGTIQLSGADNRLPTGGGVTIANAAGAVLDLNGRDQEIRWLAGGGATGGAVVNAGAAATLTINLGASGARTYDGTITGNLGLVVKNSTTKNTDIQVLTRTNTYNGQTVVDNGHLRISGDGMLGAVPGSVDPTNIRLRNGGVLQNNNSSFVVNANRGVYLGAGGGVFYVGWTDTFLTIAGPVSGPGSLTKTDSSTLGLMGDNSYTGKTIVNAGILSINSDAGLGAVPGTAQTDNVTLSGGTLCNMTTTATGFTGGNNITLNANRGITLGAGGGTIRLGYSQPMTIPGPITGGALTLKDSGSLTLTGTNTYTTTNIDGEAGYGQQLRIGDGGTSGTLGTGAVTIGDTLALVFDRSDALAVANDIGGAGTVRQEGSGTTSLSGNNTYTGTTTVSAGTLVLQNTYASPAHSIAAGAVLELNVASGTRDYATTTFSGTGTLRKTGSGQAVWAGGAATFGLGAGSLIDVQEGSFVGGSWGNEDWTGNLSSLNVATGATFEGVEANVRVDALTGGGTVSSGYPNSDSVFTVGVNNGGGTFAGAFNDGNAGANLTKIGTGTQTISGAGSTTNTASGRLQVDGGMLIMGGGFAGDGAWKGDVTINTGGTLRLAQDNIFANGSDFTINTGGVLDMNGRWDVIGNLAGGGDIENHNGWALLLDDLAAGADFGGSLSGTGGLTLRGAVSLGTQTLSGANTYTGATTINAGTLTVSGSLSDSSDVTVASAATYNVAADDTIDGLNGAGSVTLNANRLTVGGDNGTAAFSGVISGVGGGLTKIGTGTQTLSGTNTFSGDFVLGYGTVNDSSNPLATTADGGFVVVGNDQGLGTGAVRSRGAQLRAATPGIELDNDFTVEGGGLRFGGSNGLKLSGTVTLSGGARSVGNYSGDKSLTLAGTVQIAGYNISFEGVDGGPNGTIAVSGQIAGSGNVNVKDTYDNGTVILSGANTYTGATTVSAGTLLVNGDQSAATGAVTVQSGATLGGTGTLGGPVTVESGGTLAPGTSAGILHIGSVAFGSNSTLAVQIGGTNLTPTPQYDQLDVTGIVTFSDPTTLSLSAINSHVPAAGDAFTVIDNDEAEPPMGGFDGLPEGAPISNFLGSGLTAWITYAGGDGNDVVLLINDAPTDIDLTPGSVDEHQPVETVVGTLSTMDPDLPSDTHAYTLVSGTGDGDNGSFTIDGDQLKTAAVFDFETKNSYSIRVRTTDQGGLWYEEACTVTVTDQNLAPTDLMLSSASVAENQAIGTAVGTFTSTDDEAPAAPFTYMLVSGTGDGDNGSFTIDGDQLKTAAEFDFETKNSYSIRVRTTDQGGLWYEEA